MRVLQYSPAPILVCAGQGPVAPCWLSVQGGWRIPSGISSGRGKAGPLAWEPNFISSPGWDCTAKSCPYPKPGVTALCSAGLPGWKINGMEPRAESQHSITCPAPCPCSLSGFLSPRHRFAFEGAAGDKRCLASLSSCLCTGTAGSPACSSASLPCWGTVLAEDILEGHRQGGGGGDADAQT